MQSIPLTVDHANPTGVPYSPIFGTPGSSTKWQWDGVMDHNTYSVPFSYLNMPNQPFSATYRLYIGDAAGNELLVDKNGTPVSSAATNHDLELDRATLCLHQPDRRGGKHTGGIGCVHRD